MERLQHRARRLLGVAGGRVVARRAGMKTAAGFASSRGLALGIFPIAALAVVVVALSVALVVAPVVACEPRGSGDLAIVIERGQGSAQILDTTARKSIGRISGLGDLSHASAVFSRDTRYAYIFGRDGGLSKIDLLCRRLDRRVVQAGNSIGGAISQDGSLIAVSNYQPGGVKVFDSATLEQVADIPARMAQGGRSRTVGLADAPGRRFVYSRYDDDAIEVLDMSDPAKPKLSSYTDIGKQPYDGLITPDGRWYIAGLFGEDGLALLDLWRPTAGVRRILSGYGRGERRLPVYKMPHMEGWAMAGGENGGQMFLPAVGFARVIVVDPRDWTITRQFETHGQPIFAVARPDGRQVWVNFARPHNDTLQVIDTLSMEIVKTMTVGEGVLHMEFTPRGESVWVSVKDMDQVHVYDTESFTLQATLGVNKPSGIFMAARAHKIGL